MCTADCSTAPDSVVTMGTNTCHKTKPRCTTQSQCKEHTHTHTQTQGVELIPASNAWPRQRALTTRVSDPLRGQPASDTTRQLLLSVTLQHHAHPPTPSPPCHRSWHRPAIVLLPSPQSRQSTCFGAAACASALAGQRAGQQPVAHTARPVSARTVTH